MTNTSKEQLGWFSADTVLERLSEWYGCSPFAIADRHGAVLPTLHVEPKPASFQR